jgi:hypothetical protein
MKDKDKKIDNALYELDELLKLLTERISDLHEVKGGMQARHAYVLYRKYVWDIIKILKSD